MHFDVGGIAGPRCNADRSTKTPVGSRTDGDYAGRRWAPYLDLPTPLPDMAGTSLQGDNAVFLQFGEFHFALILPHIVPALSQVVSPLRQENTRTLDAD